MTEEEKIQQLLDSKNGKNNFLALQLMLNVLEIPFQKAFLNLKACKRGERTYTIEILDLKIEYTYTPVMLEHFIIERKLYYKNTYLDGTNRTVYMDEIPIYQLSEEFVENEVEFVDDRKSISAKIEMLFKQMEQNQIDLD